MTTKKAKLTGLLWAGSILLGGCIVAITQIAVHRANEQSAVPEKRNPTVEQKIDEKVELLEAYVTIKCSLLAADIDRLKQAQLLAEARHQDTIEALKREIVDREISKLLKENSKLFQGLQIYVDENGKLYTAELGPQPREVHP